MDEKESSTLSSVGKRRRYPNEPTKPTKKRKSESGSSGINESMIFLEIRIVPSNTNLTHVNQRITGYKSYVEAKPVPIPCICSYKDLVHGVKEVLKEEFGILFILFSLRRVQQDTAGYLVETCLDTKDQSIVIDQRDRFIVYVKMIHL